MAATRNRGYRESHDHGSGGRRQRDYRAPPPVIYLGGPTVYRTFGAPPYIADMRAAEPLRMAMWSTLWFVLFLLFALYAASAIRFVRRLPLLRPVLVGIAVVYAVRGLAIVPQLVWLDLFAFTRVRDAAFSTLSILLALAYAAAARHSMKEAACRP